MSDAFGSPESIEAAFYAAFATVDSDAMGRIWSDAHPVACIHPGGGLLVGKQAVLQSWVEILSGSNPPRLEQKLVARMGGPGLRVHLIQESIRPAAVANAPVSIVIATNVYVREDDGWRMTLHHASLPMVPSGAKGAERKLH